MKNEKGFALIEVIIAIALLGIISTAFLGALATASKAIFVSDERATAESLARSQMEYVKNETYTTAPDGGESTYQKIGGIPDGYTIWSVDRSSAVVSDVIAVPWDPATGQPVVTDAGLQKITVIVSHHGNEVITLDGYKVDR